MVGCLRNRAARLGARRAVNVMGSVHRYLVVEGHAALRMDRPPLSCSGVRPLTRSATSLCRHAETRGLRFRPPPVSNAPGRGSSDRLWHDDKVLVNTIVLQSSVSRSMGTQLTSATRTGLAAESALCAMKVRSIPTTAWAMEVDAPSRLNQSAQKYTDPELALILPGHMAFGDACGPPFRLAPPLMHGR